jgi:hypothetical protein
MGEKMCVYRGVDGGAQVGKRRRVKLAFLRNQCLEALAAGWALREGLATLRTFKGL